jgi:selenide,water dikinase
MEDLVQVLSQLPSVAHPNLLVGIETGDDAAVYRLNDDASLILTVDFLTPITDDPFEFGTIAAANSLSDVYAMGGKPLLALNIVGFPADLDKEILGKILQGGYAKAAEADCLIVGGHTVGDAEPKYGLSVVGLVEPGKHVTNAAARPGDSLVLTKALGTGIITTGGKQGKSPALVLQGAVESMAALSRDASEAMMKVGVNSCTDVTGFGLLGHLKSMAAASNVGAQIHLSQVPVIPGTWELLEQDIVPDGTRRNLQNVTESIDWHPDLTEQNRLLLSDAQTSGGLLISVSAAKLESLLAELTAGGVPVRSVIGGITEGPAGRITVSP